MKKPGYRVTWQNYVGELDSESKRFGSRVCSLLSSAYTILHVSGRNLVNRFFMIIKPLLNFRQLPAQYTFSYMLFYILHCITTFLSLSYGKWAVSESVFLWQQVFYCMYLHFLGIVSLFPCVNLSLDAEGNKTSREEQYRKRVRALMQLFLAYGSGVS